MHGAEQYWFVLAGVAVVWILILATLLTLDYLRRDEED